MEYFAGILRLRRIVLQVRRNNRSWRDGSAAKVLANLAEDLESVRSTNIVAHKHLELWSQESWHCSAPVVPGMHGTCGAHTLMQENSHTQKIK